MQEPRGADRARSMEIPVTPGRWLLGDAVPVDMAAHLYIVCSYNAEFSKIVTCMVSKGLEGSRRVSKLLGLRACIHVVSNVPQSPPLTFHLSCAVNPILEAFVKGAGRPQHRSLSVEYHQHPCATHIGCGWTRSHEWHVCRQAALTTSTDPVRLPEWVRPADY